MRAHWRALTCWHVCSVRVSVKSSVFSLCLCVCACIGACLSFAQVHAAMMKILKYIKGRPKMFESPDYPLFVLYLDRWNALYIGNEGVVEELFFLRQY